MNQTIVFPVLPVLVFDHAVWSLYLLGLRAFINSEVLHTFMLVEEEKSVWEYNFINTFCSSPKPYSRCQTCQKWSTPKCMYCFGSYDWTSSMAFTDGLLLQKFLHSITITITMNRTCAWIHKENANNWEETLWNWSRISDILKAGCSSWKFEMQSENWCLFWPGLNLMYVFS